jgi:hypothetical protein
VGGRVEEGSGGGGGGEHVVRCGGGRGDRDARSRRRLVYQEMCASRGSKGARGAGSAQHRARCPQLYNRCLDSNLNVNEKTCVALRNAIM